MAIVFFDTSALIKRYDQAEAGANRVLELCDRALGNTLMVSALVSAELASALSRKVREGRLSVPERDDHWAAFRDDERDEYRTQLWTSDIRETAERLVFLYPLKAYDAVHLATALQVSRVLAPLPGDLVFCTADRAQARAAAAEGLAVELSGGPPA